MALDTSDVLDLSKENIQPLRHGRKAAQLKTALQAQSDPEVYQRLLRQREIYEYQIRMYEGNDPFDPYYKYVLWLEQSFPSGCEKNLFNLIEDTLLRFKDCDRYKQDPRLVQLLIKYINFQPNPLELYQLVYNQGLGTMCSMLYKAWAEELDKSNDFKKADEVLKLGLRCRAQPLNELEEYHVQFQLSVARRFLDGYIDDTVSSNEPTRTVLSKLKPSKVKTNRTSKETPGVLTSVMNKPISKIQSNSVTKFQVYQEDTSSERSQSEFKNENENFPKGSATNRENTMAASKWSGQKLKQCAYKISLTPGTPCFEIHEDKEAACNNIKTTIRPAALRSRKGEFKCPVAVFEPPDPHNKPMYPKHLVYVGGRDVQLEEIRAARYWKNIEKMGTQRENENYGNVISEDDPNIGIRNQYSALRSTESKDISSELFTTPIVNHIQTVSEKSLLKNPINFYESSKAISDYTKRPISTNVTYLGKRESNCEIPTASDGQTSAINAKSKNNGIDQQMFEDEDSNVAKTGSYASNRRLKPSIVTSDVFVDEEVQSGQHFNVQNCQSKQLAESLKISVNDVFPNENAIPEYYYSFPKPSAKSADFLMPSGTSAKSVFKDDSFDEFEFSKQKQGCDHGFDDKPSALNKLQVKKNDMVGYRAFDPNTSPFHYSPSTSMTVNTKAAMNVIQQMWESPLTQKRIDENPPVMPNKYAFSVYREDPSPVRKNIPTKTSVCAPFPVYCEDTILQEETNKAKCKDPPKVSETANPSKQLISWKSGKDCGSAKSPSPLIVPVVLQNAPLELDDKENVPANTYRTPTGHTPPTSIDVHVDSDKEDGLYAKDRDMDDETCDTRAFAIKLPSSTPSTQAEKFRQSRKSLIFDGSDPCDDTFTYAKTNQKPLATRASLDCSKKANKNVPDLSLILENSKEQGSNSSGSTGSNAGSKF